MDLSLALCLDNKLLKYIDGSACNPVIVPVFKSRSSSTISLHFNSLGCGYLFYLCLFVCSGVSLCSDCAWKPATSAGFVVFALPLTNYCTHPFTALSRFISKEQLIDSTPTQWD